MSLTCENYLTENITQDMEGKNVLKKPRRTIDRNIFDSVQRKQCTDMYKSRKDMLFFKYNSMFLGD